VRDLASTAARLRVVTFLVIVAGISGAGVAVARGLNALTLGGAAITVPVVLMPGPGSPLASGADAVRVPVGGLPAGTDVLAPASGMQLVAETSTGLEQLLRVGGVVAVGLGVALGSWLLVPVLRSIGGGVATGAENARRLTALAAVVAVAGLAATWLPAAGTAMVATRTGAAGGPFTWVTPTGLPWLLAAGAVLVVAEAFRQGERLSRDVEGLV
jgi:hypothetical protein